MKGVMERGGRGERGRKGKICGKVERVKGWMKRGRRQGGGRGREMDDGRKRRKVEGGGK